MRISLSELCDELRKKTRELQTDSRKVGEGDVFAAMPPAVPGEPDKSAAHIAMALEKGAWCVAARGIRARSSPRRRSAAPTVRTRPSTTSASASWWNDAHVFAVSSNL